MDVDALRALVGECIQVELATVVIPPVPGKIPNTVTLAMQPGNRPGEARVAWIGAGPLAGILTPLLPGTEVICLVPNGNPMRAVIIGSFHSLKAPPPASWLGTNTRIQNPAGNELRSAEGLPADGIVLGAFLVQIQAYVTAMDVLLNALASAAAVPGVAPAQAVAVAAAVAAAVPVFQSSTAAFKAALATSASFVDPTTGGFGGAPFASTLNRATT